MISCFPFYLLTCSAVCHCVPSTKANFLFNLFFSIILLDLQINQTEASSVGKLGSICDEPSSLDDFLDGDVDNRKDGQCVPNDEKETAFNCLKTNVNGSCEESSMNNEKPPRNNESVPLFESDVLESNETTTDHHAGTVGSDDETHSRMALDDPSTPQKMMGDPSCANSDPLHSVNEKYHCTACTKMSFEVHSHPILRVIICGSCKYLIEEKLRVKVRHFLLMLMNYISN